MKFNITRTLLIIITAFITYSITSCSDDAFEVSNTQVQLSYLDADGMDMLDTIFFDWKKVDIYYLINGAKVRVNDNTSSIPENFFLFYSKETANFALAIFVNTRLDSENKTKTLIDFGTRVDTLTAGFKVWDAGLKIEQVWYNDQLLTNELDPTKPLTITVDSLLTNK